MARCSVRPCVRASSVRRPSVVRPSSVRPSIVRPSIIRPSSVRHPSVIRPSSVRHPSVIRPSSVGPSVHLSTLQHAPGSTIGCHQRITVVGAFARAGSSRVTTCALPPSASGSRTRRTCHVTPLSVEKSTTTPSLRLRALAQPARPSALPTCTMNCVILNHTTHAVTPPRK